MSPNPASKLALARVEPLLPRLDLPREAANSIGGTGDAAQALATLEAAGFLVEATRLVAHALPSRESVWWACMCARHTAPEDLSELARAALEAAEAWVRSPADEARRAAFDVAQREGFASAEAWAAVAAFWSGESMSPPGQPAVPPPPFARGAAVAGAVALASVRHRPEQRDARLARFLASARDVASGGAGRLPPEAKPDAR